jgi:hypothetical protein
LSLALILLVAVSCGGSSSAPQNTGPLNGNWQLNLTQDYPLPQTPLSAAGFLVQSNNTITGSVQGPSAISSSGTASCGGVGPLNGTVSGQNVTFSLNPGATVFNFTGVISSDNKWMTGSYQGLGGGCFANPTSGTWTASLVPPLTGNFTGTLQSSYMQALTGASNLVPVAVSGSFTQSSNADGSTASITGTITAVGYPCFTTAYLSGSLNGQNAYLNIFDYSGQPLGTLGTPPVNAVGANPAVVAVSSTGLSLTGTASLGPCPTILTSGGTPVSSDTATATFNF